MSYPTPDTLWFPKEVRPAQVDRLASWMWPRHEDEHDAVVLDFSRSIVSFPNAMVPIITWVQFVRAEGMEVDVIPPESDLLRSKWDDRNWSHYLLAGCGALNPATSQTLPVQQYTTSSELNTVIQQMMDCICNLVVLHSDALVAIDWSLGEIADNVLNHAESPLGGFVQLQQSNEQIAIVISDNGRGLYQSLQPAHSIPNPKPTEAIKLAVLPGTTRDPKLGAGMGMTGALAVAKNSGGQFVVRSHDGIVRWADGAVHTELLPNPFPGTCVDIQIGITDRFDAEGAIGGNGAAYQSHHRLEEQYLSDDLTHFHFVIREEQFGHRTRSQGRLARTRLLNILQTDESKVVVIDWEGIEVAGSGFVDELAGMLLVQVGTERFNRQVRMSNATSAVRKVLNAILEHRRSDSA